MVKFGNKYKHEQKRLSIFKLIDLTFSFCKNHNNDKQRLTLVVGNKIFKNIFFSTVLNDSQFSTNENHSPLASINSAYRKN